MDLELIKKLEHFNIYANIGLQFDRIDKFENIALHIIIKLETIGLILLQT